LPSLEHYRHEVPVGFDYKVSNNNLLFGESNAVVVVNNSAPAFAPFVVGYSGSLPDHYGQTSFRLESYFSLGYLLHNNTDAAFETLRSGARADYEYVRFNAERDTPDCPWTFRGSSRARSSSPATGYCPAENSGWADTARFAGTTSARPTVTRAG